MTPITTALDTMSSFMQIAIVLLCLAFLAAIGWPLILHWLQPPSVKCRACHSTVRLKRGKRRNTVILENMDGWTFTSYTGWICPRCFD